jgi:GTP-binding protein HflX
MERVLTIGLQTSGSTQAALRSSMEELSRLVETAGGKVIESHTQARPRPDPATFIGSGKTTFLAKRVRALGIRTVIFDDELKPVQQHNLENVIEAKVVDRTRLILDIFARRARTHEGILQVELAQLNYLLPRITARFGQFEQQTGGIGTRGPGERKLEIDRRRIRDRISYLQNQIEKIRGERKLQRRVRQGIPMPQVALVGYTNAGKSTLLNRILTLASGAPKSEHRHVYADDKLFATLDPTTRRVRLPSGHIILFSDTVGFIQKLPTELIAAFRATLEEISTADLVVHIVDAADPAWLQQSRTVVDVLTNLHLGKLPRLTAYNKIDRLSTKDRSAFENLEGVSISAATGDGIDVFLRAVETKLSSQWIEKELLLSYDEGHRLAGLYNYMDVLKQQPTAKGIRVRVRAHPATLAQWLKESVKHTSNP